MCEYVWRRRAGNCAARAYRQSPFCCCHCGCRRRSTQSGEVRSVSLRTSLRRDYFFFPPCLSNAQNLRRSPSILFPHKTKHPSHTLAQTLIILGSIHLSYPQLHILQERTGKSCGLAGDTVFPLFTAQEIIFSFCTFQPTTFSPQTSAGPGPYFRHITTSLCASSSAAVAAAALPYYYYFFSPAAAYSHATLLFPPSLFSLSSFTPHSGTTLLGIYPINLCSSLTASENLLGGIRRCCMTHLRQAFIIFTCRPPTIFRQQ